MSGKHAAPPRRSGKMTAAPLSRSDQVISPSDQVMRPSDQVMRPSDLVSRPVWAAPVAAPVSDDRADEMPAAGPAVDVELQVRRRPRWRRPSPSVGLALGLVAIVAAICFLGPLAYHPNLTSVNLSLANRPPSAAHPLGTDQVGKDILGLLMAGGRLSLAVGFAAGLLAALMGALWGAVAGYLGGVADALMMRIVDAVISIPVLVLLLLLAAIYQPSPAQLIIVIAATSWLATARLVRGATLTLKTREFVQAVKTMGGGPRWTIARHIAPNVLGIALVSATQQIADAILVLATLSYLNLGIRPPDTDWGDMVASGVQNIYNGYWWQIVPVGIAIVTVVVALNLLGDGLSDAAARRGGAR